MIKVSLSGLNQFKRDLQKYKTNVLERKAELLARRLAEKGVEIAKSNITTLDAIFTGELLSSMRAENGGGAKGTAIFYVVADSRHAAYVEFGTGQLGLEGGYPYPFPEGVDWQYNTGKTIFEISPGQYGWFYQDANGNWYFTQGMPSRPFMYETSLELMQLVVKTAKEVFA
jgi:hypothetical protein